jgi:CRP/FNR family transcriptional regulator
MITHNHFAAASNEIITNSVVCHGHHVELKNQLFEISSLQEVDAKDTIFWEGDQADYVYELLSGVVLLFKSTPDGRRQITDFVYPGRPFGMGAGTTHSYTAEAVTPVRLCRYSHARLNQSMNAYPALGHTFLTWTRHELAAAQDQMLLLGRKSATEKVASFLLRVSEGYDERGEDPLQLFMPMTRNDIGDYLGLTTETVSRTITQFDKLGVISRPDQSNIVICDYDRLIDLADAENDTW